MSKNHPLPLVAIVGQPNAGKSTLLNKISGRQSAITSELAGTTRDRQYIDTAWNGVEFTLVDTAGLAVGGDQALELSLLKQIDIAVEQADVVMFIADGKEPVGAVNKQALKKFRNSKKPMLLVVNKLDSPKTRDEKVGPFTRLGIKPIFAVSAVSGLGMGDMLDFVVEAAAKACPQEEKDENAIVAPMPIAVSIVGKPNVGKSSIFNAILKEERVVVSPIPGTTRTAIDSEIKIDGQDYTFIDTAGLKKKEHRQARPDIFAGFQTFKAIRRSDICFFVIDANEEITKQDQRVANEIFAMDKGCIILVNKMDMYTKDNRGKKGGNFDDRGKSDDQYQTLRDYISHHFSFLWMCPAFFVSATTGEGLEEALSAIKKIFEDRHKVIDDETLKTFLAKKLKINPPKLLRDQREPKVYALRQLDTNPPLFELYVNRPGAISTQFRKFLENAIIKDLGFWGSPITLKLRGKDKT
ncbi:MAG: ribosome biogenesis GTPase Der [Candidatus Doudnabacteria bacterium]|jgi:GTP-binding protein